MAKDLMDYIPKGRRSWVRDFYQDQDGYWLNLHQGYENTHYSGQVIHEDTIKDVLAEFRQYVVKL